MSQKKPTHVLITVDTEVWPRAVNWPHKPLPATAACQREIDSYFWGGDTSTKLGLPFQLEVLNKHKLLATFFVDPLFSFALGLPALKRVVEAIQNARQDIGLHLHPEWLTDPRMPPMPAFSGPYMRDYAEPAQHELINRGLARLAEAGAGAVDSFRAGSWGADTATLRALVRNGIRFDSSLNACYDASLADLPKRKELLQPAFVEGLWEFPLTNFIDRPPSGRRELQVCACSLDEFEHVLEEAYSQAWDCVVIVTHSFEFVRVNQLNQENKSVGPMRLLGKRFEALCSFLAQHRDRFPTVSFSHAAPREVAHTQNRPPIVSNRARTFKRVAAQALSTVY